MGNCFTKYFKELSVEVKTAFISTFLVGLLVHIYKFTNYLPNHDSMYNFYSTQNAYPSGRWFLSVACGFSSYFDLPWVNGILSLIYISLTTVIIVKLFEIKNPVVIILSGAVLVTFPAVTEIFFFEFTADGFMLSMLLASLAVYIIRYNKMNIIRIIISAVLLCFSCGIYQAFFSFASVLAICYYIWVLYTTDDTNKSYIRWFVCFFISCAVGLLLYFVIWKIVLFAHNRTPFSYQGIDKVGLMGLNDYFHAIINTIKTLLMSFFERNIFKHGISIYGILNLIFLVLFPIILIITSIKAKIWKRKIKAVLFCICIFVIPFAVTIWLYSSPSVKYANRMLQSISLLFIFSIILCNQYIKIKISDFYAVFICLMIINNAVAANVAYYYLGMEYEATYAEAIKLQNDIENTKNKYDIDADILIVGNRNKELSLDYNGPYGKIYIFSSMIETSLLSDSSHIREYMKNVLYYKGKFIKEDEVLTNKIISTEVYKKMSAWPDKGSIELINDIIVVKLQN